MCLHVLGSWIGFFLGESALVERMYAVFYVRLAGFTLYSIFTFRGALRESVDARCCSSALFPHAYALSFPFFPALPPPLPPILLFFL
jgi:hypothetical protein